MAWMEDIPPPPENTVVVFKFIGGPNDGIEARSDVPASDPRNDAEILWMISSGGRIGTLLGETSEYALGDVLTRGVEALTSGGTMKHLYVLEERNEEPGELICVFHYRPEDASV